MKCKKNKKKTILNRFYLLVGIMIIGCSHDNGYFLKNQEDKNNFFEIKNKEDSIFIFEHYNFKKELKKILLKDKDGYLNITSLKGNKKDINPGFFLAKRKVKYLRVDRFSLLNDSVITGNKDGVLFYTEIKSNKKPVNYRYYYDENYKIIKIVIKIGNDIYLYE